MTKDEALKILGNKYVIKVNNSGEKMLINVDGEYLSYYPTGCKGNTATLDGEFTADELEAVAVIMREMEAAI